MTYAIVEAADLSFSLAPDEAHDLCGMGQRIKAAAVDQLTVEHPENPAIPGITNTEFTGPLRREDGRLVARNTVVVSPGRCDRSPCGTGTSARLAVMQPKGQIRPGETFIYESITGSRFTGEIERITRVGPYEAVVPAIAGQARITGLYQMGMDPTDPYQSGFTLSDTWMNSTSGIVVLDQDTRSTP